jgi:hypothetical protein
LDTFAPAIALTADDVNRPFDESRLTIALAAARCAPVTKTLLVAIVVAFRRFLLSRLYRLVVSESAGVSDKFEDLDILRRFLDRLHRVVDHRAKCGIDKALLIFVQQLGVAKRIELRYSELGLSIVEFNG